MKHEIKLMVWDNKSKIMIDMSEEPDGMILCDEDGNAFYMNPNVKLEKDRYEILLGTGFKDDNGVDAYDGSILSTTKYNDKFEKVTEYSVVTWDKDDGKWIVAVLDFKSGVFNLCDYCFDEVVGHKYTNPEYLKCISGFEI